MKRKLGIVLCVFMCLTSSAQRHIEISRKDQSVEKFLFSDFRKITFENGSMNILKKDQSSLSIEIPQIKMIQFADKVTSRPTELAPGEIALYPNPVVDWLMISAIDQGQCYLSIYDLNGTILYRKVPIEGGVGGVDLSALPEGVYVCEVECQGHRVVSQFIKK